MTRRSSIGKIVWLREIREKAARRRLASAHSEEQEAREHLDGIVARYEAHGQPSDIVTPSELRALQLQGLRLHELVDAAEAIHAERVSRLTESRDAWRSAAADLDSAENLQERRVTEEAGRARAAAERALDELHLARRPRRR